jgi:uncharacterized protein YdhG (YjbR/CyaY superfamily)
VAGPESVDVYLDSVPQTMRGSLETLRRQIRAEVPDAAETVSYGVPMFKLGGRPLVSFGAASKHLSLYVMSPAVVEANAAELESFKLGKGSVQFTPDRPIPEALVKKLVRARVAELG